MFHEMFKTFSKCPDDALYEWYAYQTEESDGSGIEEFSPFDLWMMKGMGVTFTETYHVKEKEHAYDQAQLTYTLGVYDKDETYLFDLQYKITCHVGYYNEVEYSIYCPLAYQPLVDEYVKKRGYLTQEEWIVDATHKRLHKVK